MSEIIVFEKISKKHFKAISKIHLKTLNEGILVKFGLEFLIDMYKAIISHESNFGYVALKGEEVVGFAIGLVEAISLVNCLKFNSIIIFLKNMIISPSIIFSLYILLTQKPKTVESVSEIEISQIAVKKGSRGSGIGRDLINLIEKEATKVGINNVTTRTHNKKFVSFYIKKKGAVVTNKVLISNNEYSSLSWVVNHKKKIDSVS